MIIYYILPGIKGTEYGHVVPPRHGRLILFGANYVYMHMSILCSQYWLPIVTHCLIYTLQTMGWPPPPEAMPKKIS